jgi:hypothetical protein
MTETGDRDAAKQVIAIGEIRSQLGFAAHETSHECNFHR